MSRALRDADPGDFFHVSTRGNSRCQIYEDAVDRAIFMQMLDLCRTKHNWRVYAWCLMTTHYHVVLSIPDGGLSPGMCRLNGGFARWSNKRHGREDHLFGKRYSGTKITTDEHLFEAIRYVVLNPVRSGLCAHPGEWPWSSYNASAGIEEAPSLLAFGELIALFGVEPGRAVAAFRDFVRAALS